MKTLTCHLGVIILLLLLPVPSFATPYLPEPVGPPAGGDAWSQTWRLGVAVTSEETELVRSTFAPPGADTFSNATWSVQSFAPTLMTIGGTLSSPSDTFTIHYSTDQLTVSFDEYFWAFVGRTWVAQGFHTWDATTQTWVAFAGTTPSGPPAVPIPPTAFLLASGLLGLAAAPIIRQWGK